MMNLLDEALELVTTLPPLPEAILALSRVVQQAFPRLEDVVEIIEEDPALAAATLRVANSAAMGARTEVTSVARGVSQIGPRTAIEVAMSAAFSGYLPRVLPGYALTRDEFIKHSVTVGRIADSICHQLNIDEAADAFTCGLLHDCGKLVLCRFVALKRAEIELVVADGTPWANAERAVLGADHTILGEALARSWGLPSTIAATARWHHAPFHAPSSANARLCAALNVADEHAHALDGDARSPDPDVLDLLCVDEPVLVTILAEATLAYERKRSSAA